MLCTDCFRNMGLRFEAAQVARPTARSDPPPTITSSTGVGTPCPNCGGLGLRLTKIEQVDEVIDRFFVRGSTTPTTRHEPIYRFSPSNLPDRVPGTSFDRTLRGDVELLARHTSGTIFRNAPNTWRMGYTDLEDSLEQAIAASPGGAGSNLVYNLLDRVIDHCPIATISEAAQIYRIRCNVARPFELDQFDAPQMGGLSRFSDGSVPILYGAFDVETCLHESRICVEDEITLATLLPTRCLNVLDLTNVPYDEPDPSVGGEGGDIFYLVNAQLLFGPRSCQGTMLAERCRERHLDGIKYPSFLSNVRPRRERFPNVALFGRPIHEGIVQLQSLNNIRLETVRYEFGYGPVTQTPSEKDLRDLNALVDRDWINEDPREIAQRMKDIFARSDPPQ